MKLYASSLNLQKGSITGKILSGRKVVALTDLYTSAFIFKGFWCLIAMSYNHDNHLCFQPKKWTGRCASLEARVQYDEKNGPVFRAAYVKTG